jgi:hypothetical protein
MLLLTGQCAGPAFLVLQVPMMAIHFMPVTAVTAESGAQFALGLRGKSHNFIALLAMCTMEVCQLSTHRMMLGLSPLQPS